MKRKISRCMMALLTAILVLPSLNVSPVFAGDRDWLICEAQFIAEPIEPQPPVPRPFGALTAWEPSMPLPNRPLTAPELLAWNAKYCAQGHVNELELEILRLTNLERANYDLPPLTLNHALSRAARFKSQEMLDLDYFAHQSPVYGHWSNIPMVFIDSHQGLGENLFSLLNWQPADITAGFIVQGWMDSPPHRENILRPQLTELGVGVVVRPPMGAEIMNAAATQMFGHAVAAPEHCVCIQQTDRVLVSAEDVSGEPGDFVDVEIRLNENPGLIGLQLDVDFDRSILTAISVTPGTLIPLPTGPTFPIPAGQPLGLTFEAPSFVNIFGTGVLAALRFEINPNANPGTAEIILNGIMAMSGEPYYETFEILTANGLVSIEGEYVDRSVRVAAVNTSGTPGGYVNAAIFLNSNPGLIGLQLDVDFDRSILTAVNVTPGTLIPLPTQPTFPIPAGQPLGLTFEAPGFDNIYRTGVLAVIRFRIDPDAGFGTTEINLEGIMAMSGEPDYEMFEISAENGSVFVYRYRLGDVTGDERVSMADVTRLARYVAGHGLTLFAPGDVDGDGDVDTADISRLGNYIMRHSGVYLRPPG